MDPILGHETSPQDTNMSLDFTDQGVAATLTTLRTPLETKRKRQTPMYFKTRNIQRVRPGKPQTPTKGPITIEESPKNEEEIRLEEGRVQEATSSIRTTVTYIKRHSTRLETHTYHATSIDPPRSEKSEKQGEEGIQQ